MQQKQMDKNILEMLDALEKEPERIADFLEFGSRFYKYSLKNNLLIYRENPQTAYCQSFASWNQAGYKVKKGAKGIRMYVPYQATILNVDGKSVPLEQASKEEKIRYQAGEIESITQTKHNGIKAVFDIAQTTCPVTARKKFYQERYPEGLYPQMVKALLSYAEQLSAVQETPDEPSGHQTDGNAVPELVYQISHGISRMEHLKEEPGTKFQEAAFAMLLENHLGIVSSVERKEHLVSYWKELKEAEPEQSLFTALHQTYKMCRRKIPEIQETLELYLEIPKMQADVSVLGNGAAGEKEQKPQKITNEELIAEIKNQVQITDYAREHGFTLIRKGRYYTLAQHDSVRIDTTKNYYWRNSIPGRTGVGKGDSIIGFAAEFVHNGDLHEALKELTERIYIPEQYVSRTKEQVRDKQAVKQPVKQELHLPEKGKNMRRVYAYLTKSRYIAQEIVQDFVDRKMLYQDVNGNCVFVAYDAEGNPNFASLRGTLSDIRFLGDVEGCDYTNGFYINNHSEKLIVTESVIDAMSVMTILEAQGKDWKAYDYLPLGGTGKYEPLRNHLKEQPKSEILLAEDHDISGVTSMQLIKNMLVEEVGMKAGQIHFHVPEKAKDWNQELTNHAKKLKPVSEISFLEKEGLPRIHYCAIQSTEQTEEKGFRIRDGKHQYRLVELDQEGSLVPVALTKQNTMFFTPEDVEKRILDMYKKIPYNELLERQNLVKSGELDLGQMTEYRERAQGEKKQEADKPKQEQAGNIVAERNGKTGEQLILEGFKEEENLLVAKIRYKGEDLEEGIWKVGNEIYLQTGMVFDNTSEKHLLTEEQVERMNQFLKENHYELDETYPILQLKACGESLEQKSMQRESYLNRLQQQEMQKNQQAQAVSLPAIGMEL